ncbi:MAG: c-type cytochrome domain-containing protein, partial [Limisphaerales bacterium]
FGPYTLEQVNQYLVEGSIVPTDSAWYDGAPDWIPLPKVPGVVVPAGAAAGAAAGGSKKTIVLISIAAVAAAAIAGGIVFVAMNKGDGSGQSANASGNGSGGGGNSGAGSGNSSGNSSGGGGDGMGMDGGMMGMDGDNMMAMDGGMMGMDGGGADSKKVHALFEQKCFKCHGNGKSKGGYSLESRGGALDAITPGNPGSSLLLKLVRRDDPDDAMPPKDSDALSKAEVAMVEAWIKAGAKW